MTNVNLNRAEFIQSAAASKQFIHNALPKVAFAGRSNVGKSSVINRLLNRKKIAKVGITPGKTVHINYFLIDGKLYFVDLPGYGFAKVSQSERDRWADLMESFFSAEDNYDIGVLVVDVRHKPTKDDMRMADYFKASGHGFLVVANKLDKIKKSEAESALRLIRQTLELDKDTALIPFSAEKGEGREQLISALYCLI